MLSPYGVAVPAGVIPEIRDAALQFVRKLSGFNAPSRTNEAAFNRAVEEEFRVGTMGLGWDADSRTIVVELLAVSEEEVDESVVLDDTEEGPDALRVLYRLHEAGFAAYLVGGFNASYLRRGDVVLIRTGRMQQYRDADAYVKEPPGISMDAARFLVEESGAMLQLDTHGFRKTMDELYRSSR